jgi:hypothetical protein
MKKLCIGVLLASALLFAQTASAEPCGICQAYYPCSWSCENCEPGFGGPGLWVDGGYCWGEVVESTCGESGQCSGLLSASNACFESVVHQGAQSSPTPMPAAPQSH